MEFVVQSFDLVNKIISRLHQRRDFARCSVVSRLWHRCCKSVNPPALSTHLLSLDKDFRLWMLDTATGNQQSQQTQFENPGMLELLAACEGLVLVRVNATILLIGEPITNVWKVLPRPDRYLFVVAAALIRNPDAEVLVVIMFQDGRMDRYSFQKRCWLQETLGLFELSVWSGSLFYHQDGFFCCFYNQFSFCFKFYSLSKREWEDLYIQDADQYSFFKVRFLEWHGRLLVCFMDRDYGLMLYACHFEVSSKVVRLVKLVSLLEVMPEVMVTSADLEEDFLWLCEKKGAAMKLSLKDMSIATLDFQGSWSTFCYTSDEGQAMYQFRDLETYRF